MREIHGFKATQTSSPGHRWKQTATKPFDVLDICSDSYEILPWDVIKPLENYINERQLKSLFLRAVLENNFNAALHQMPTTMSFLQLKCLRDFIVDHVPEKARGSVTRVEIYLRGGVT